MMVTLRLYRQHDLDLITLYRHPSFSLANAIKRSLFAYVRKEQLTIKQPEPYQISNDKISKTVQMHIYLDTEIDKDIITWLKKTKEGYRNSVLKNIIRGYLSAPCIYSYQDSDTAIDDAIENKNLSDINIKNISEIKGKGASSRKKSNKKDTRKVEDSQLAKEILNRKTVKSEKTDVIFIERIDDDEKEKIDILKQNKQPAIDINPSTTTQKEMSNEIISDDNDNDDDMFSMFDSLMQSM